MKAILISNNAFYLFLFCSLMLGGCTSVTTKNSPLYKDLNSIDISQESIAILSIKVSNKYKPKYQPIIVRCNLKEIDEQNGGFFLFQIDGEYKKIENEYSEYLVSFQLPPGRYNLQEFYAEVKNVFPKGKFTIPIHSTFEIESNEILYLGHIEAQVVAKTMEKQLRAGPTCCPIITQIGIGATGGTFVIQISDWYDHDIALFKKQFPCLSNYRIKNKTLPPLEKTVNKKNSQ